jgi:acyl dehydratase
MGSSWWRRLRAWWRTRRFERTKLELKRRQILDRHLEADRQLRARVERDLNNVHVDALRSSKSSLLVVRLKDAPPHVWTPP